MFSWYTETFIHTGHCLLNTIVFLRPPIGFLYWILYLSQLGKQICGHANKILVPEFLSQYKNSHKKHAGVGAPSSHLDKAMHPLRMVWRKVLVMLKVCLAIFMSLLVLLLRPVCSSLEGVNHWRALSTLNNI